MSKTGIFKNYLIKELYNMSSFSERMGITQSIRPIQLDGIDKPLLNRLWNIYSKFVIEKLLLPHSNRSALDLYRITIWHNVFKENYDKAPISYYDLKDFMSAYFFSESWYKIYNLIEYSSTLASTKTDVYINAVNSVLEEEYAGYRFINGIIAPITNNIETDAINEALNTTQYTFDGHANIHLSKALKSISDKPNPDYRNSVKEAISAVGTVVRKITGKNTFGEGLKYLEQHGLKINNQFKEGLNKFYNYTNDPSTGIRHEIIDAPNPPDFETAKFMLLSCSAFINYLIPLAQKANINVNP